MKVVILTGEHDVPYLLQLTKYSIAAILLKSYNNESFLEAFKHLHSDAPDIYLDPRLEKELNRDSDKTQLSNKEFEVLSLLVKGFSNKAIAEMLSCSPETIKSHLANITRKTQFSSRDSLMHWFYAGKDR